MQLGYGAACALPLAMDDGPPLTLTLHASEPDAFGATEVALLEQLVEHAMKTLRGLPRRRNTPEEDEP